MPKSDDDEIKLMDAAVYPSRYISAFWRAMTSIGRNIVVTTALVSIGCISSVLCIGARASVAIFDVVALRGGRRHAIKDGEKSVSCYSYSPLIPPAMRWPPVNIFVQKIVKSDEGPLRASSGAFFYVVVKGSFIDYVETTDSNGIERVERVSRTTGSSVLVSTGDRHKVVLEGGDGACWRIVVSLGRDKPKLEQVVSPTVVVAPAPAKTENSDSDTDTGADTEDVDPLAMHVEHN